MRAIITLLAILVVIGIVAVATGFINLRGNGGSLPTVAVSGGALPSVQANVGSIEVSKKKKEVEVPTVDVKRPE